MPPHNSFTSSSAPSKELSLRGIILGAIITVIFTTANVYLGLKLGLTFASSIPAAIISMAVLRLLGGSNVLENNIVQTQASAAGTLSCVFAALPGLIFIGWWQEFPYIPTVLLTMTGGMTGVLFTIPLRRALVNESQLPYPEGVACAEILHASSPEGDRHNLRLLSVSSILSACISLATSGLNICSSSIAWAGRIGSSAFSISGSFSLALLGTGYLVGIAGGLAMLLGVFLAWDVMVPILGKLSPSSHPLQTASLLWSHKVRFIGAGMIAVSALWTLLKLSRPVIGGVRMAFSRSLYALNADTDRDISPRFIVILGSILALLLACIFIWFLLPTELGWPLCLTMSLIGLFLCLTLGFIVASACGYMAGIVGSSSSPISGIGIIAIIIIGLGFYALENIHILSPAQRSIMIGFSLFILSAITASAAVSNDNLQDLKTGQILGATPWKQEIALLIGCAVGALIIPWILNIVYNAYGFVGHLPRPNMDSSNALPAPQPALMSALAYGIITHTLHWDMLEIGALLGIIFIIVDIIAQKIQISFPPLAIGMGLYLPPDVSTTVAVGAILGYIIRKGSKERGTMISSGFIVGESLVGVLLAGINSLSGRTDTLSILSPKWLQNSLGLCIFICIMTWFAHNVVSSPTPHNQKD